MAPIDALAAAAAIGQCLPCGSACQAAGVGRFLTHPGAGSIFYPMCATCYADAMDPGQAQAFADAIRRRFVALGEMPA